MTELNRPIGTQKKVNEKETGNAKTYSLVPLFQKLKGKEKEIRDNGNSRYSKYPHIRKSGLRKSG